MQFNEGNGLSSITSCVLPKKIQTRMPLTKFLYLEAKSGPSTVPLFRIGHKCFELWDSYFENFNLHSWHWPSHIYSKYRSGSELGGRKKRSLPLAFKNDEYLVRGSVGKMDPLTPNQLALSGLCLEMAFFCPPVSREFTLGSSLYYVRPVL
ncbi:pentatricopeptide repeat-containing protein [Cucumis melo var. makuwa]|uniref:Pentatricopeptide repeat-containing protein n=1 Tax=Cucumis melo var. makuwa TaxID=1194695 RepID=A0A5D3CKZ2_CUCMM|nr:pentatricopeptide repeat-containing protein [Cucumis melo var. makuwa]TYK12215.1 pentatricopeptide repeat-containing protein [Cucumis melo var. makuwa]